MLVPPNTYCRRLLQIIQCSEHMSCSFPSNMPHHVLYQTAVVRNTTDAPNVYISMLQKKVRTFPAAGFSRLASFCSSYPCRPGSVFLLLLLLLHLLLP